MVIRDNTKGMLEDMYRSAAEIGAAQKKLLDELYSTQMQRLNRIPSPFQEDLGPALETALSAVSESMDVISDYCRLILHAIDDCNQLIQRGALDVDQDKHSH